MPVSYIPRLKRNLEAEHYARRCYSIGKPAIKLGGVSDSQRVSVRIYYGEINDRKFNPVYSTITDIPDEISREEALLREASFWGRKYGLNFVLMNHEDVVYIPNDLRYSAAKEKLSRLIEESYLTSSERQPIRNLFAATNGDLITPRNELKTIEVMVELRSGIFHASNYETKNFHKQVKLKLTDYESAGFSVRGGNLSLLELGQELTNPRYKLYGPEEWLGDNNNFVWAVNPNRTVIEWSYNREDVFLVIMRNSEGIKVSPVHEAGIRVTKKLMEEVIRELQGNK